MMTDDERQWARLIDGELPCSEQRALLAALDDTPNGWKRLALGLLEADAFRRELRDASHDGPFSPVGEKVAARPVEGVMRGRVLVAGSPPHPNPLPRSGSEGTGEWSQKPGLGLDQPGFTTRGKSPANQSLSRAAGKMAIVCAIGIICLGLGMGIEHARQPAVSASGATGEGSGSPVLSSMTDGQEKHWRPQAAASGTRSTDEPQTHQTLKLVFADGPSGAQSVDVPVIEAAEVEAAKLLRQSAVPEALRRKLEAHGYVIHEERTYVPISLANGRQGIAPVSDVVVEQRPTSFQ